MKNGLTVVVNKLYVADQKVCAEEIVKRCRENSFKSVRFSYDQSIPNALYVTVYSSKRQAEKGIADVFIFLLAGGWRWNV